MEFLKQYQWVGAWIALVTWLAYITWLVRRAPVKASAPSPVPTAAQTNAAASAAEQWGQWARDSSDKYLVVFVWIILMSYNLHILHHGADSTQLQFVNGLINNLEGAFLTLVTGAVLRKTATATTEVTTAPKQPGQLASTPAPETRKTEAVTITDK